ncbi:hypothetical protein DSO57_1038533 [Entomophthora muscae]|uniref:Uncharacterized protein n=1 Tax=Entomophthora muscae TaxID=34485 RepID=A0ACC2S0T3_9FUNG|nr:hypothetical protein DSO57_1038533 [Entomophthora muscae]
MEHCLDKPHDLHDKYILDIMKNIGCIPDSLADLPNVAASDTLGSVNPSKVVTSNQIPHQRINIETTKNRISKSGSDPK